ncbi:Flp pilus assembly CpaF family ATPase [Paraburkholderia youngii]|uniref:hypothetical protein n=1 Tax=Paraburkholderia youngii TaxID=2782701 RepID=UPI003D1A6D27
MSNEKDELLKAIQTGHPGVNVSVAPGSIVGHTITIGSTSSGKTTWLLEGRKANEAAMKVVQKPNAPYYRQFDKRR